MSAFNEFGDAAQYQAAFEALERAGKRPNSRVSLMLQHFAVLAATPMLFMDVAALQRLPQNQLHLEFGTWAHLVCSEFGITSEPGYWGNMLVMEVATDAEGRMLVTIRPEVREALNNIGWFFEPRAR